MYEVTLQWQIGHRLETQVIPIGAKDATIGRRTDNTLVIMHNTVSRLHAALMGSSNGVFLRNLSQTNPIVYQGSKTIAQGQQVVLKPGDFFKLGRVTIKVLAVHNPLSDRVKRKCAYCGKLSDDGVDLCSHCGSTMTSSETLILPKKSS